VNSPLANSISNSAKPLVTRLLGTKAGKQQTSKTNKHSHKQTSEFKSTPH
jgi:hypothetical protein